MTDHGELDQVKGRAEEAAGDLADDDQLKRSGRADQAAGKLKEKVGDLKDSVEDGIDRVTDKVKDAMRHD